MHRPRGKAVARARRGGVALVASAAVLAVGGPAGCSLILDFDDPPPPPDAMEIDAIPADACAFGEPNDARTMAHPLELPVQGQVAAICTPGDRDFYSFAIADGVTLTIDLLFDQLGGRGDLDLRLYDENGTTLARSLSADDNERIVCPGSSPSCVQLAEGTYFIEVFGFAESVLNGYTLSITAELPE